MSNEFFQGIVDLVHEMNLTREIERELRTGWHMDDVKATIHQNQVAHFNHTVGRRFLGHGLGQVTMNITPKFYHDMVAIYGPQCWRDKDFRDSVHRKNPEVRVKSRSDKTMIVCPGLPHSPAKNEVKNA